MTIFVPSQQQSTTHYVRWITISSFVILMLWLASFFYDEYRQAEYARTSALKFVEEVQVKNAEIEAQNAKAEEHNNRVQKKVIKKKIVIQDKSEPVDSGHISKAPELPKTTPEEAVKSIPDMEPIGGGSPMPPPPKPVAILTPKTKQKTIEVEEVVEVKPTPIPKESKIEIDAGIVKVAMSNESSWMAIFKMIFTVLFTFFGIKLINFGFRRLEGEPKPA